MRSKRLSNFARGSKALPKIAFIVPGRGWLFELSCRSWSNDLTLREACSGACPHADDSMARWQARVHCPSRLKSSDPNVGCRPRTGSVAESARAALARRVGRAAPKGMSCEEHPVLGLPSPIDGLSGAKHGSRSHGERGAIPPGAVQISPSPT